MRFSAKGSLRSKLLVQGFLSSLASNVVSPFMSVFFFELAGGSFLAASVASQLPAAVSAVMSLVWARVSDATGKRRAFVALSSATGVATGLALSYASTIDQVVAVQALGAITGSAGGSAFSALLAEKFREKRGEFLGRYNAAGVLGGFLGSLASGPLYTAIGFRNLLRLYAALNAAVLAVVLSIEEDGGNNSGNLLRNALRVPKVPRKFWRLYAARLAMSLPGALSGGLLGIYFLKYLGGTPEEWAAVTALTVLAGLSSVPYGRLADKLSARQMFTLAGLGWAVLYAGYFLSPNPLVFAAFFIFPVWPLFWVAYSKALMDISDEAERATFFAFEGVLSTIYGSAVGMVAGRLADTLGPRTVFLASSAAALAATALVSKLLSDENRAPALEKAAFSRDARGKG